MNRRMIFRCAAILTAGLFFTGCASQETLYRKEAQRLQKLVDAGNVEALNELGVRYQFGRGVERDAYKACDLFREAAGKGVAQAQYNLGLMCLMGEGVVQSNEDALKCFEAAAEQGMPEAQMRTAVMYERGLGTAADAKKAREWYRKAADNGHRHAQYIVGSELLRQDGSREEAVKLILSAAEQGVPEAQTRYAVLCLKEGTPDKVELAAHWFELAAKQGDTEAQFSLGQMQMQGRGMRMKDEHGGLVLIERAAAQGYPAAEYFMGLLYLQGKSVKRNETTAKQWLTRAAKHGVEDAAVILKDLNKQAEK